MMPPSRGIFRPDDKVPRRVILLQELHVRRHVRVDFCKFSFVNELDDEHAQILLRSVRLHDDGER